MRLDKYLSDLGVGTRSELRRIIRQGRVTVNDIAAKDPGLQLAGDERVALDGAELSYERYVYYMLNKPAGVITAVSDSRQMTVLDLLGERRRKDLFPVGRLDKDTTGLLIITNDGDFDHRLMSPKHHVDKCYAVTVRGLVTEEDVRAFAAGLRVDAEFTAAPAKLAIKAVETEEETAKAGNGGRREAGRTEDGRGEEEDGRTEDGRCEKEDGRTEDGYSTEEGGGTEDSRSREEAGRTEDGRNAKEAVSTEGDSSTEDVGRTEDGCSTEEAGRTEDSRSEEEDGGTEDDHTTEVISHVELTICEGKYHQVKRMFAAVGKEVIALKRVAIGSLDLDPKLPEGSWRELTEDERQSLLS